MKFIALIGFLVMLGVMVGIGINQPRGTSMKTWCYGYLAISVVFDMLVVFALIVPSQLANRTPARTCQRAPPQA